MAEVAFANAAEVDLSNIDAFSAADSGDEAAVAYMRGFDGVFARLAAASCGRTVPNVGVAMRCLTHRQHRVSYRIDGETVLIVRFLHHAMDARLALGGH